MHCDNRMLALTFTLMQRLVNLLLLLLLLLTEHCKDKIVIVIR